MSDGPISFLLKAPVQGEIPRVSFDTDELLARVKHTYFASLTARVSYHYAETDSLASIRRCASDRFVILLHSLLNHPGTPVEVVQHILIHELIHVEIPPRELLAGEEDPRPRRKVRGQGAQKLGPISHPPEFWEREEALSVDRIAAMSWIIDSLYPRLRIDRFNERICVKSSWRRSRECLIYAPFKNTGSDEVFG